MIWVLIDEDRWMLVPPSTLYPTTPIRWHHKEECAVASGKDCDCKRKDMTSE